MSRKHETSFYQSVGKDEVSGSNPDSSSRNPRKLRFAKSCFMVRVKNPDPHRDPHAETVGKDKKAPDGKICLPVRFLLLLTRLYNLSQDAAHSLGGLVLLLLRGVGVGAQGEPGIVVPRHGGHGFDVHAVLEGCGGEGVTEIMEADMLQSGVLQDLLM